MAIPDRQSPVGQVDWIGWLQQVLPHVDLFLPSIEETLFMLGRTGELPEGGLPEDGKSGLRLDPKLLASLADQLLEMGTKVVVLKLGEDGLYLKSTASPIRLTADEGNSDSKVIWGGRELAAPCFQVDVTGTTGAGDSAIAG